MAASGGFEIAASGASSAWEKSLANRNAAGCDNSPGCALKRRIIERICSLLVGLLAEDGIDVSWPQQLF
jgi:hypothetical protein